MFNLVNLQIVVIIYSLSMEFYVFDKLYMTYHSHSCDQGQEVVKGSRAVFGVGQAVKDNFQTR